MTPNDSHAWWSRLRHQGLLLSPVVMLERFPDAPAAAPFHVTNKLRDAAARFASAPDGPDSERVTLVTLAWVDALLEQYLGHKQGRLAKSNDIPVRLTTTVRIGTRTETLRPHRVVFADAEGTTPALLVMTDPSPHVGRGRGRTSYARFLELLRGTGHRLGLLTNGRQFRLVYAGLDFESWCEWEADRWFDDGDGSQELAGLRLLLSPDSLKPVRDGVSGLLEAVEDSRKRQADLSSVLRENVRQAVELLLDEASSANRTAENLFAPLVAADSTRPLTDAEAHEALLQATVRVVMRLVVCLFAESRGLLPVNDPVYASSYGVRSLYELLEEATRNEGGTQGLMNRETAWPRLMALFRLIHGGSAHGQFPLRAYGGVLFRPGKEDSSVPVVRALHVLEHGVVVTDATVFAVLRKLLRGPLPVIRGRAKTFVEGPVDYTDLRTEFIGLIYEGLLDYRLKRTDAAVGPQVFLNLGREPVLPLSRLREMLEKDRKGLKDLLTTLKKEKVTGGGKADEAEEEGDEQEPAGEEVDAEADAPDEVEAAAPAEPEGVHGGDYLDAVEAAKRWAAEAVVLAGLVTKQGRRETNTEYQARIGGVADRLIKRVVATGEFYLVRAGNTRKGTGTFYTRPQLAVPTVHRTLEPLCYDKADDGTLTPKRPEVILGLKVCDPACGSASFLVAALHYLTEALYRSLCFHMKLDDPAEANKVTLPYGRPREGQADEEVVRFFPDDPQQGEFFADRVKALLRRHVVERCIYGVDINPLAVEFARVSLWVETLDPGLPFSFLDHKIKVGNALVGCWLDRVADYPLCAWEREGGDGKDGPRTQRIETFLKGPKVGNRRSGDGVVKREMRDVLTDIKNATKKTPTLFNYEQLATEKVIAQARADYEKLHDIPSHEPAEREEYYRDHVVNSPADAANPYTLFDLTAGRRQEFPQAFLAGYRGFVHADAYDGYNAVHNDVRHLGCWMHARRYFVDAEPTDPRAVEALAFVRTLYAVEREITLAREKPGETFTAADVVRVRRTRAGPILAVFAGWLDEQHRSATPKSLFGQAVGYARNQWASLVRYLDDARFALDNGAAERAIRPLAIGRTNWLHVGGDGGLKTASVLLSVCASATRHRLDPWSYLTHVLSELPARRAGADLGDLLPDAWAKARGEPRHREG
ncbi:IS66 family transposase [Urbifossiella limnaea]|uniref:site-specific DNA-methyltransferase (adenine-specific) n=1 Tax=Urbifossiella limnaea TaxID=2528023 RepID=A0A517Y1F4_9BACT|nr:IS66 family transposase [Urbifossiella limnaea]QDU23597.1 Transposase IS66 family protein [Urbifossiella limnaea]